jgi:hypothetical protein
MIGEVDQDNKFDQPVLTLIVPVISRKENAYKAKLSVIEKD